MALSNEEIAKAAAFGVAGWAAAAAAAQVLRAQGAFKKSNLPVTWLAGILIGGPGFILPLKYILQPRADALVTTAAVATATAAVFDGAALAFFPKPVYGSDKESENLYPAALILWGAGFGILFSLLLERL
jgi:hypothetical protein